jgi:hypothetical protein
LFPVSHDLTLVKQNWLEQAVVGICLPFIFLLQHIIAILVADEIFIVGRKKYLARIAADVVLERFMDVIGAVCNRILAISCLFIPRLIQLP